jgi:LCP family protein required for cell wall assembly
MRCRARLHGPRHSAARGRWARLVGAGAILCLTAAVAGAARSQGPPARAETGPATPGMLIGAANGASYVPALQGKRPIFILAIGSDGREGLKGRRADSIHILGVDLKHKRATVLGIPRDSWVAIPGFGQAKINSALEFGGPSLMVRTVESVTGLRMDFWMMTTFTGFKAMVDRIGGLKVDVPYRMKDRFSGSDFKPGVRKMNGKQALAFSRDRHSVPGGDFGRVVNQGRVLLAALAKFGDRFRTDPTTLFEWIAVAWKQTSSDVSVPTLLELGLTAAQIKPGHVNNLLVPSSTGQAGGASVVFISPSAQSLYADMKRDGVIGARGR